ncbi:MAG TPA: lipopolysaccharide biosynthesis [Cyanobacteria bacterium UBA11369]|nr:lipopolysaccharide biosynthesis [Cyanobacteria bacterium UBA11371]HBE35689.1 lipopolysaccharide biosynthesis [Cyanobacteria bacterium UBA11368]HBE48698.1 lipopolysaccharide biosynthesis [Cyanobacteria bacterium UBA11369]
MTPPIVKRYFIAFDQYKWIGLAAWILVTGASALVAAKQEPEPTQYTASGAMLFIQPPVIFSRTGTDIQQQAQVLNRDALLTEDVIKLVAKQVGVKPDELAKKIGIQLPKPPGRGEPPPAPRFGITYTDANQDRAKAVVATLMKALVEQSRSLNVKRLRLRIDEINKRLPAAEKDLREAERKLEQYTKREGVLLLAARDGSILSGITGSQAQQRQIQFQLQGIDAQIRSLQERLGLTADQAYTSSALSADPIIASLRAQIHQAETQKQLLGEQGYRAAHPRVVELDTQLKAYNQLLSERASEVIGNKGIGQPLTSSSRIRQDSSLDPSRQQLAQQLVGLKTQQDTLKQQLVALARQEQQLRREYLTIPNKQLEQARLQQTVKLKQDLYSKIQAALVDAQAAEAETATSLTIAEPVSTDEIKPAPQNPVLIIAAGAGIGFIVGNGLIFLLGSLGGILQTMEEIRAALVQRDVEVLGILPHVLVVDPEALDAPIVVEPNSPYLELYERFRSKLRLAGETAPKVVLFTSTIDGEGKSVSAYNLAIASARAGKRTLLIEADLRSPSLCKALKVAPDPDANVEPLRYYGSLSECIRLVPEVENLYIVPSPGPMRQPAAILESSEFQRLLEDAKVRFDMVILDTPAISLCNDAKMLEPFTDGMILVTRPGYTGGNMLGEIADELSESEDLTLLGAIINGADISIPAPTVAESQTMLSEEPETVQRKPASVSTNGARKK